MESLFFKIMIGEILFIIMLALMETGVLLYLYEALYTRPLTALEKLIGSFIVGLFFAINNR